jgi:PAS domain S-box-containing protein
MSRTLQHSLEELLTSQYSEVVLLHGPKGVPHYVAGNIEQVFQVSLHTLLQKAFWEYLTPNDAQTASRSLHHCFKSGQAVPTYLAELQGSKKAVAITTHAIANEQREIVDLHTTIRDVTHAKQLRDEVLLLDNLVNETNSLARVGGWKVELATNSVYWSPQVRAIHEVPDSYVPTVENAIAFYHPEVRKELEDAIQTVVVDKNVRDLEFPFTTFKGNELWVRVIIKVEVHNGQPVAIFGAFQDITERKQREMEMELMISNLKKQNEQLEEFGSMVSHNLRSPLAGIQSLLSLLDDEVDADDKEQANKLIRHAVHQLDATIRELARSISIVDVPTASQELQ